MGSKDANEARSKVPIIFGLITSYQVHDLLEKNGAKRKETKAVFLISENSTPPGVTKVSYYSQEHDMVQNVKIGLTGDGWKTFPEPPQRPKLTDSLESKERYKHKKDKFDRDIRNFLDAAKTLFEQDLPIELIKTLKIELQNNEFKLEGLIKPTPNQATQNKHYINYVDAVFIPENLVWINPNNLGYT